MYYARIEREREKNDPTAVADSPWVAFFKQIIGKKVDVVQAAASPDAREDEKSGEQSWTTITDRERDNAYRTLRVASWQAVFYLIRLIFSATQVRRRPS